MYCFYSKLALLFVVVGAFAREKVSGLRGPCYLCGTYQSYLPNDVGARLRCVATFILRRSVEKSSCTSRVLD